MAQQLSQAKQEFEAQKGRKPPLRIQMDAAQVLNAQAMLKAQGATLKAIQDRYDDMEKAMQSEKKENMY